MIRYSNSSSMGQWRFSSKRFSLQSILLLIGLLFAACAWLILLLRLFGYDVIFHIFYPSASTNVGDSIFAYRATKSEYFSTIKGLQYSIIDKQENEGKVTPAIVFFKLGDLLSAWNPDNVSPQKWAQSAAHPGRGNGLPRFDYSQPAHVAAAFRMRDQELPFVVYNVPALDAAAMNQFSREQLLLNYGNRLITTERMPGNKYMYYSNSPSTDPAFLDGWTPPQTDVDMTFPSFLRLVQQAERHPDQVPSDQPHYYHTVSASEVRTSPMHHYSS